MEDGQEPRGTGEPVTERARIAGVEAGVAAGLVPSAEAAARPTSEPTDNACATAGADEATRAPASMSVAAMLASYELPDWTDPPTLQLPRVLLDLEQEAAVERGGPLPTPPGGPVWRERQEDWNDSDALLADLAKAGLRVTASEESSSDDPFAYDFLSDDGESSWLARNETPDDAAQLPSSADTVPPVAEPAPPAVDVPDTQDEAETGAAGSTPPDHSDEVVAAPVRRRRHVAGRARRRARRPVAVTRKGDAAPRNPVVATVTGVVLAAVLLLCFSAGPPAVLALVVVAVTLAAAELFNSLRLAGYRPATLLGVVAVPAVIIAAYFRGPDAILLAFVIFIIVTMVWYLAGITRRSPLTNLSVTVFAFGWTGVLAAFAGLLVDPRIFPDRHGIAFMLGAIIAAVGYDVGGYAVGSRFGKHSLAPSVSPNKTWEGLIGGCAVAIGASAGITSQIHPWHVTTALVLGLIVAVVAPCGDLVESMIKRDLGVKDMGSLLPGHGGMLDRIDALLFVLPAAYYFVRLAHV
ncbi:MAG: phosphatidate cytidylyltransferase [Acidimicrobiales bacterium]